MNLRTIEERLTSERNLPDDFYFSGWRCYPDSEPTLYVEMCGGRCQLITRGKRKGRPNYRTATERQTFVVTVEQADQWEAEYEEMTGNCRECRGEGKVVAKVDFINGTKSYRECRRCNGSGRKT